MHVQILPTLPWPLVNSTRHLPELIWHVLKVYCDTLLVQSTCVYNFHLLSLNKPPLSHPFLPLVVYLTQTGPPTKKTVKVYLATASSSLIVWFLGHLGNNAQSPHHPPNPNTMPLPMPLRKRFRSNYS